MLVAVKLWDTATAIEQIKPIVGPHTTVISFQNGVLKDTYLRDAFGAPRLMGGVGYVATAIDRPGVIRQTGPMQRLLFGELDGTMSERGRMLLDACLKGGIAAQLSPDIQREIWQKYVFIVGLSGTTTTIRKPIGPIRENPQTRAFLLDVMREVVAVGRAHGIDLPSDYAEQRLALADDVAYDMTSSMHHDLERGNRLEVRWLSGGVVELGKAVGVPAPLNRAIADILALHEMGNSGQCGSIVRVLTIRSVRTTPVLVPMTYALGTSAARVTEAPLLLIDLETEEGITGRTYLFCYRPQRRACDCAAARGCGVADQGRTRAPCRNRGQAGAQFCADRRHRYGAHGAIRIGCGDVGCARDCRGAAARVHARQRAAPDPRLQFLRPRFDGAFSRCR